MKKPFLFRSRWHFKVGMLFKLPSVFFWGIRLDEISDKTAVVRIPYMWRTQNPFNSIYFAAQAGAAELSTGLLITSTLNGDKDVSMLVIESKLEFYKKATGSIRFICEDGNEVVETLEKLQKPGDTETLWMTSIGYNSEKEEVSKMKLRWSFRKRGKV